MREEGGVKALYRGLFATSAGPSDHHVPHNVNHPHSDFLIPQASLPMSLSTLRRTNSSRSSLSGEIRSITSPVLWPNSCAVQWPAPSRKRYALLSLSLYLRRLMLERMLTSTVPRSSHIRPTCCEDECRWSG